MSQEELLPLPVRAKAVRSGNEFGWRPEDLPQALAAAKERGLAVIGGQVQFVLPGGTCELYWQNFDSSPQTDEENWAAFVKRSHAEVAEALRHLPSSEELVNEGIRNFEFLRECVASGVELGPHLTFICYFSEQDGLG